LLVWLYSMQNWRWVSYHLFAARLFYYFVDFLSFRGHVSFFFRRPSCVRETCPQTDCKEALTEEEVAALAPDLLPKFVEYQLRSFVEMNGLTRWCPGPGCTKVAMASSSTFASSGFAACVAECKCGTLFCLRCGEEPHAPCSCAELGRWQDKCRNESETANWILANTKCCPKCNTRIEKNQGCNHMSCQQCKWEFCWICMGSWAEHGANTGGYYKCNRYDPLKTDTDQSAEARAKRELDRYLHYYKRYDAHNQAQKFAEKQLKETEAKMVLLQESSDNSLWADVEFLKNASEQLIECRRVLKYTYTFAYYMTDGSKKKERFEHHQEMLEKFTESLSEQTELPISEMNRTDVINQTRVVDKFMKNILSYVEDGMEED
jgi:ariadne-1